MDKILLAIPCFNEENTIAKVVSSVSSIPECEVLVFIDGSTDASQQIVHSLGVSYHYEMINRGLGKNFQSIIEHFLASKKFSSLVVVDADGQFTGDEVRKFVKEAQNLKKEFVSGSRFLKKENSKLVPFVKRLGNRFIARLLSKYAKTFSKIHIPISDPSCGLRWYTRKCALSLQNISGHSYTLQSLISIIESDLSRSEVSVEAKYFSSRQSVISGNLFRYAAYVLKATTNLATLLYLKLFFGLSVGTLLIGSLVLLEFITNSVETGQFSGNLYLAGIGAFSFISALLSINVYFSLKFGHQIQSLLRRQAGQLLSIKGSESEECPNCYIIPSHKFRKRLS